jgi:hypothetical protein
MQGRLWPRARSATARGPTKTRTHFFWYIGKGRRKKLGPTSIIQKSEPFSVFLLYFDLDVHNRVALLPARRRQASSPWPPGRRRRTWPLIRLQTSTTPSAFSCERWMFCPCFCLQDLPPPTLLAGEHSAVSQHLWPRHTRPSSRLVMLQQQRVSVFDMFSSSVKLVCSLASA